MLKSIRDLIRKIAEKFSKKKKPAEIAPVVAARPTPGMVLSRRTIVVGGEEHPVYLCNGSRKLPHVLAGSTFVPLKNHGIDCGTF